MKKDKKKTVGIKTARYFTKTCDSCGYEYPNWFTNCPKCGAAWDVAIAVSKEEEEGRSKKNVKIIAKITEEQFDESINRVQLVFSADHGNSWYQMKMEKKMDYYLAEIIEVPIGSEIIYFIEVYLNNGEKIVENNDGKYFYYKVGTILGEKTKERERPPKSTIKVEQPSPKLEPEKEHVIEPEYHEELTTLETQLDEMAHGSKFVEQDNYVSNKPIQAPPIKPKEYREEDTVTIFGKPLTEIDPDLKVCPHCKSKIKKMWSVCPICGKRA
ncbi:MAG: hypothetical protein DRP02_14405 [Candidatus Gerdarchaeota archaeon]|nr:MAG: hypothetical protein DRP02_14405 [Candidatus Gerdarchaeota archaeon]